ncbi:protein argonaute-2-like [Rhipicephalus sanguineus]|uniref:protein argonaute-2-like n=1 Tax=Rhipicephalus sanguineus TaxID=34632 RepID=UPI0018933614|nr:protein argonaute-2-like [Rhipicephalus sanguineus]
MPQFNACRSPLRPGTMGRPLMLRANHFAINIPGGCLQHYDVTITPDNCPLGVNREVVEMMVQSYSGIFGNLKPVFDGRKTMYTTICLPFGKDLVEMQVTLPGRDRVFLVAIKWVTYVSFSALKEALTYHTRDVPMDAVQALDVIFRQLPSMMYTPVGRSFFSPEGYIAAPLGEGREAWHGYHQSVELSKGKPTLNVDVSATAFYKAQTVIDFMCEVLHLHNVSQRPLTDSQRFELTKEIKGLKIEVTHGRTPRKYRVCDVTPMTAHRQTFPWQLENGVTVVCTVAEYFLRRYEMKLRCPQLPCLQVGPEHRKAYLPLEVCNIVAGQRCTKKLTDMQTSIMIRESALSAPDREDQISNLVRHPNFSMDPYAQEFDVSISDTMMKVKGRVLPPPRLLCGGSTQRQVVPRRGVWDMRDKEFYLSAELKTWALTCFASPRRCAEDTLRIFTKQLHTIANGTGMRMNDQPCAYEYARETDEVEAVFRRLMSDFPGLQLVVVVLPGKTPIYAEVKRVGDTVLGMATQCVDVKNVTRTTTQALSNMCLKINCKLGGINSIIDPGTRPKVFEEPVIFIGASVTRSPPSDNRKFSIAAVVGSVDGHPSRYAATLRVQQHDQEIIQDLASMVKELLLLFYKSTKMKPVRIVIYRDAVSEGQFGHLLTQEILAVREACLRIETSYKPGITLVAVQRRHHTRFFCADKKGPPGGNIPAGTTVDTDVTHPLRFDFYLCSHTGIQGTSRPSYYRMLWDDNCLSPDELHNLTYQLCHTYLRSTRSVSVPAPTYYAQLVGHRARYHVTNSHEGNGDVQEAVALPTIHPHTCNTMYFI